MGRKRLIVVPANLRTKSATLLALYFAQGLPFGFQATALPLLLRERGVSLKAIGFASLLSLPWLLKAFWAPLVDRYGSEAFGRRKSWIVPMQACLCLTALAAAYTDAPRALLLLVILMNLFAATQDIAVDGLAVTWLEPDELGPANAVQVVGYKMGMLTGGGLLLWASARIGRDGMFEVMAALMAAVLVVALGIQEPSRREPSSKPSRPAGAGGSTDEPRGIVPIRVGEIVRRLVGALRHRETAALLLVVATYKTGEAMADAMWKPLLLDRGFASAQIGLWTGTFGMLFSLAGSAGAGVALRRVELTRALVVIAAFRTLGVAGEWWVAQNAHPAAPAVIAITCLEHALGGALTTVLFALMMRHTDREIGGSHYTLLASVEVWGKLPLSTLSGFVAAAAGYGGLFGVATGLSAAFVFVALCAAPRLAAPRE